MFWFVCVDWSQRALLGVGKNWWVVPIKIISGYEAFISPPVDFVSRWYKSELVCWRLRKTSIPSFIRSFVRSTDSNYSILSIVLNLEWDGRPNPQPLLFVHAIPLAHSYVIHLHTVSSFTYYLCPLTVISAVGAAETATCPLIHWFSLSTYSVCRLLGKKEVLFAYNEDGQRNEINSLYHNCDTSIWCPSMYFSMIFF